MSYLKKIACACGVAALFATGSVAAAPIVLDFEGIGDFAAVNGFYNGGTDSSGASGTNYGIQFSLDSIGLVDSDAGGSGTISGMPSGTTVLAFFSGGGAVMNVSAGFDTRLAFHYAAGEAGFVNVYDGLNRTGNLLAMFNLPVNVDPCQDGSNLFCVFSPVEILFAGTARSVIFGGLDGWIGFDDVAIGALDAGPAPVPEPASLALGALGLAGLAASRRKAGKPR